MNNELKADSGSVSKALQQTPCWLSGRLTAKKLVNWCNEQFKKFEIHNYLVTEISRTHFNKDAYEGGACRLLVKYKNVKNEELHNYGYFMCFYTISEYQDYINAGYELCLKNNNRFGLLNDLEINVRKR